MQFKKYNSIENTEKKKFVDKIYIEGVSDIGWGFTEKMHGSNFSMWYDGNELKGAKRSSFLDDPSGFFNADTVMNRYGDAVKALFNIYELPYDNLKGVAVYGELIGGHFDDPNVPDESGIEPVQKGVSYTPDREWVIFDIALITDDEIQFVGIQKMMDLVGELQDMGYPVKHAPFFYASDDFDTCLEVAQNTINEYESQVPPMLGYDGPEGNKMEGVVIRPMYDDVHFRNGKRVIFKLKNEAFSEKNGGKSKSTKKENIQLTQEASDLLDIAITYINRNRVESVISKYGQVTHEDFGKINGMMNKDVINELRDDYPERFNALEKKDRKRLQKKIGVEISEFLKRNFDQFVS